MRAAGRRPRRAAPAFVTAELVPTLSQATEDSPEKIGDFRMIPPVFGKSSRRRRQ
jgi:hypothetical protein